MWGCVPAGRIVRQFPRIKIYEILECAVKKCLVIIDYLYFMVYLAFRCPYCHNAFFYSLFNQPHCHQVGNIVGCIFILLFCIFKYLIGIDMTYIILTSMCRYEFYLSIFFSLGIVQCPYSVVGRRHFSSDSIIFYLGLVFPIVFETNLIFVPSHLCHAFNCVSRVSRLFNLMVRCLPF